MFLPTTTQDLKQLGWSELDVILVTGDSYIDSPYIGVSLIGKLLQRAGYRVGVIAQPRLDVDDDISRLGVPKLFWGVSAGCVDSMVANYTALKKRRKFDDYTPGGLNSRRPDRASIAYANLIRRFSKRAQLRGVSVPIVLGGIEASLRRLAHYDYWSDSLRGSLLFDAKADYLLYGMAEKATLEFAAALKTGKDPRRVRGVCYIAKEKPSADLAPDYLELPSLEAVKQSHDILIEMFTTFYENNDPITARGLFQKHGERFLVQNPPQRYETQAELDDFYALKFERAQHPFYEKLGKVKALETIGNSISTHRGCYGECNFCAIAVHEGRTVRWRSDKSLVAEAQELTRSKNFTGYIHDLGGPTANMYGFECEKKLEHGSCKHRRCLTPAICSALKINHRSQIDLLRKVRKIPGVKKVFVASGLRYDMLLADGCAGAEYLRELADQHVSGQLKVAPEHSEERVLALMGKPDVSTLLQFKKSFDELSKQLGKKQFLTYYLIAAYPGCGEKEMRRLKEFCSRELKLIPEQVQIFTPTPGTWSSVMYFTEKNPFTGERLFVEKDGSEKQRQKELVCGAGKTDLRRVVRCSSAASQDLRGAGIRSNFAQGRGGSHKRRAS